MKKLTLLLFMAIISMYCFAQAPKGFNYQAVIRNNSGEPLISQAVNLRISLLRGFSGGTQSYQETHLGITNPFGLINIVIGNGANKIGTIDTIDWGSTKYFIKIEVDVTGGSIFYDMGTSQLQSVPYALYAETSKDNVWESNANNIYNKNSGNVGIGTNVPNSKLEVKGTSSLPNDTLFQVKDANGNPVFIVMPDGARLIVPDNGSKAAVGGFAVSGRSTNKGVTNEYMFISPDSARIYVKENDAKATVGGFAVSGRSTNKASLEDLLRVSSDSINVSKSMYIPRLSTFERDNIGFIPSEALIIFNTTDKCMQIYENNVWSNIWCFHCAANIITQPHDATICSGQDTSFVISATGTNISYQWQVSDDDGNTWVDLSNGGTNPNVAGVNSWILSLSNIPLDYNGYKYRCNVTASCPPVISSNAVVLNVGSTPPIITGHPINTQVSEAFTASFSITSPGYGVMYQWEQSPNGTAWTIVNNGGTSPNFNNASTATLEISNIPASYNNYQFRCSVSNGCGSSVISNPGVLTMATPILTTNVITSIHSTSAICGGNITSNGGSAITARGVCWSTSPNPISTGNHTTDGVGSGDFISNITGLTLGVTYHVRAYATNSIGTVYGNDVFFTTEVAIGDAHQGGIVAYIFQPADIGYIPGQTHGLIAAPSDQSTGVEWGCKGTTINGANGNSVGTGNQNTIDILADCPTAGIAARICSDLVLGGYNDWYLPSKDELNKLYINKVAVGGFTNFYYWSSTQGNASAASNQSFGSGSQGIYIKDGLNYVRAVRSF